MGKKKKSDRKKNNLKRRAAAAVIAVTMASIVGANLILKQTSYTVTRVIDGDTFETSEKQRIRINGVSAPELNLCGWEDSKKTLERKVLGKKVFLKIIYLDSYRRQIADVYLPKGENLAIVLAREGSVIVNQKSESVPELLAAGGVARNQKLGLFSPECTQLTNPQIPKCNIKGNLRDVSSAQKTYHLPGCKSYPKTEVQLYLEDQWFCTEREAIRAGFKKAQTCPN